MDRSSPNQYVITVEIEDHPVAKMHFSVFHPEEYDIDLFSIMDGIDGDYTALYAAFFSDTRSKELKNLNISIDETQSFIVLDKIWVEPEWRNKGICMYLTSNIFTLLERSRFENTESIAYAIWIAAGIEKDTRLNKDYAAKLVSIYKKVPNSIHYSSESQNEEFFYMSNENYWV